MATKRGYLKEELRRAVNNIDSAKLHLSRVGEAFEDVYPVVSRAVALLIATLNEVITIINKTNEDI